MADEQDDFALLMQRVAAGSEGAARELVERYGSFILRIVRQKLARSMRPKFDSIDFVQAVWASFFALRAHGFAFQRSEALVAFLVQIARNKVVEAVRQRLQYQKYNVNRECHLDQSGAFETFAACEPTPEDIAIAREEWNNLLESQPVKYQQILRALRDGETQKDVAEQLGVTDRTVRNVLRVASAFQRRRSEASGERP